MSNRQSGDLELNAVNGSEGGVHNEGDWGGLVTKGSVGVNPPRRGGRVTHERSRIGGGLTPTDPEVHGSQCADLPVQQRATRHHPILSIFWYGNLPDPYPLLRWCLPIWSGGS